ncbi:nitroreductase family protein [Roseivirga sp. BDSF3-8]|uniref:nitroreductase family protein n=1 Tax=Roseivirga sp. BDSF3-8 TaxID=3241598 RepID=UPI00353272D3
MKTITLSQTLVESLEWRYATKKFDPEEKLEAETLELLLDAARMAPTSYGLQPFSLTVVKDYEIRQRIYNEACPQPQILQASELVIFSVDEHIDATLVDDYIQRIAETRGVRLESLAPFSTTIKNTLEPLSAMEKQGWAARQAYIAMGFMLHAAAMHRVDTCPMEGFNKEKLRPLLSEHEDKLPVVLVTIGYRAEDDVYAKKTKVRKDKNDFINFI